MVAETEWFGLDSMMTEGRERNGGVGFFRFGLALRRKKMSGGEVLASRARKEVLL